MKKRARSTRSRSVHSLGGGKARPRWAPASSKAPGVERAASSSRSDGCDDPGRMYSGTWYVAPRPTETGHETLAVRSLRAAAAETRVGTRIASAYQYQALALVPMGSSWWFEGIPCTLGRT